MNRLTWRELLQPDYLLVFMDGFLLGALPVLGIASAVTNGTASVAIHAWPSGPSILSAILVGALNGNRMMRALLAPRPGTVSVPATPAAEVPR